MSVEYLSLADYLAIAASVTRLDIDTLIKATKLDLADSALHAPSAGFGDTDFYPDFVDKAAVHQSDLNLWCIDHRALHLVEQFQTFVEPIELSVAVA